MAGNPHDHPFSPIGSGTQCKWCSFQEPAHTMATASQLEPDPAALEVKPNYTVVPSLDTPEQRVPIVLKNGADTVVVGEAVVEVQDGKPICTSMTYKPEYQWIVEAAQAGPMQHAFLETKKERP